LISRDSQIPRHYHHAFWSAITSRTHIQPHHGPTNKKLRCQFPLIIPDSDSCTLTAGGITQSLEQGKCLIFDDSFVHEAKNDSTEPRVILIFDVWHPDLSDEEVGGIMSPPPAVRSSNQCWLGEISHFSRECEDEINSQVSPIE
jgi:aspartyl/asparaginyl beta-hydroxylase (cupin superfamily)